MFFDISEKELHKPYNCQIELVRGCNFNCDFCAIEVVPKAKAWMTMDTAIIAAKQLRAFDPIRIEYAMRGEPVLHPQLVEITQVMRKYCKKSQIVLTTNGSLLKREVAQKFFEVGGNIIIMDCYGKGSFDVYYKRLKGITFDNVEIQLMDFYEQSGYSPWHRHSPDHKMIVMMRDLAELTGKKISRTINNQAGNVDFEKVKKFGVKPLQKPLEKKCSHPFREIVIFYDGKVPVCCRDWSEQAILFDIRKGNLRNYWFTNRKLNAARLLTYNKKRNFGICQKCDYSGGMRLGLLPKMKEINETQEKLLKKIFEHNLDEGIENGVRLAFLRKKQ